MNHIIECVAYKLELPESLISAEMIIAHLKYMRRKQQRELAALDTPR
jgi:hypothetical protein